MRAIAQALPERVLVCVDGVHGFGARAETVRELGCDAFVSGCHKWLYGPRGTGVLWANERARELMRPTIPSFDGSSYGAWVAGGAPGGVPDGPTLTPGGFHSFEHRWALPEAFGFHEGIGRERVEERIRGLATRLKAGLGEIKGVRLRTPQSPGLSAGLVCFEVAGRDPGCGRRAPRIAPHRRERDAVRAALRPARARDREHARARGRGGAGDRGALVLRSGSRRPGGAVVARRAPTQVALIAAVGVHEVDLALAVTVGREGDRPTVR